MRGAAGRRDDYLDSARFGRACELRDERRRAMSRDDPAFVRHAELMKGFGSGTHCFPIRLAPHDYRDQRLRIADCRLLILRSRLSHGHNGLEVIPQFAIRNPKFLLSLIQRVPALAVEVTQILSLDEIKAPGGDSAE